MSNRIFINHLRELYQAGNLVPFTGAGLSVPFQVPDWGSLIKDMAIDMGINDFKKTALLPLLEHNLNEYDYWEAVRIITRYLKRSEQDIQGYIVDKVNSSINLDIVKEKHNYADLGNMDFKNYITTNYDHILNNFIKSNFVPVNLKDINDNTQKILNENDKTRRIFHLHGNISDANSIVISEEKYKELYDNNKYKALFSLFVGTKTFLFLGFSFNDVFIQKIIKQHNEFFKSKHYIILDNPDDEQIRYLKATYNIETICYNNAISSHSVEIRKILTEIASKVERNNSIDEIAEEFIDELIEDLPDKQKKLELEKNLFCRKLRIENIDDKKIDYSKQCFFTAEQYIRWLKKSGIQSNEKIIRHMLGLCYMEYEKTLIDVYNVHKDSDAFLHSVHKALSKLQYPRIEKILSRNTMPLEINKQGFIHLIADDKDADNDVWWGGNRVE
jgi:NAD-dependent SIR2 family protein deacetylase